MRRALLLLGLGSEELGVWQQYLGCTNSEGDCGKRTWEGQDCSDYVGLNRAVGNGEEGAQPETLLKAVFVCRGETVCYRPGPVARHFLT